MYTLIHETVVDDGMTIGDPHEYGRLHAELDASLLRPLSSSATALTPVAECDGVPETSWDIYLRRLSAVDAALAALLVEAVNPATGYRKLSSQLGREVPHMGRLQVAKAKGLDPLGSLGNFTRPFNTLAGKMVRENLIKDIPVFRDQMILPDYLDSTANHIAGYFIRDLSDFFPPPAKPTPVRRNIPAVAQHIYEVFLPLPVGTFLPTAKIASAVTTAYPNGGVSPGAVDARLQSPSFAGQVPEVQFSSRPNGAKKVDEMKD
jgi:hypothetical protein